MHQETTHTPPHLSASAHLGFCDDNPSERMRRRCLPGVNCRCGIWFCLREVLEVSRDIYSFFFTCLPSLIGSNPQHAPRSDSGIIWGPARSLLLIRGSTLSD
ncbi:hypothetical protein BaRGS_00030777 [Batillaria attramentaria]|uniref:Uncharacterized protein n=1 Tax=Batillaria attramentaria TaxID=370345 RepID=A0ABD0JSV0_9CAEN